MVFPLIFEPVVFGVRSGFRCASFLNSPPSQYREFWVCLLRCVKLPINPSGSGSIGYWKFKTKREFARWRCSTQTFQHRQSCGNTFADFLWAHNSAESDDISACLRNSWVVSEGHVGMFKFNFQQPSPRRCLRCVFRMTSHGFFYSCVILRFCSYFFPLYSNSEIESYRGVFTWVIPNFRIWAEIDHNKIHRNLMNKRSHFNIRVLFHFNFGTNSRFF